METEAVGQVRTIIDVPLASRVLVVGDLLLPEAATEASVSAVSAVANDLDLWQGVGTIVILGDLVSEPEHLDAALTAHPALSRALAARPRFSHGVMAGRA